MGQNRNVQMRNNARRSNSFQAGLAPQKNQGQSCPVGQQPKMVNGRMQCVPAEREASSVPKLKTGNRGY